MEQQTFIAKNYVSRDDLEKAVFAKIGTNINKNKEIEHQIIGTREELRNLLLDDTTNIWGVKCVITDIPTESLLAEKVKNKKIIEEKDD